MVVAVSACLLYLACVGLFQANTKRTQVAALRESLALQRAVRSASWLLALLPLAIITSTVGLERAIPLWLVLLSLAGLGSLLVSALAPKRHVMTGLISSAAAGVLFAWAATSMLGGNS